MKRDYSRLFPPGADWRREVRRTLQALGAAIAWSLTFFLRYISAHGALYRVVNSRRVLIPGAVMQPFSEVLGPSLWGFALAAIAGAGLAALHYASFYRGSRSVYLMRRLPDPLEWHRRCLALPCACIIACAALAAALWGLFYLFYLNVTPAQCLA